MLENIVKFALKLSLPSVPFHPSCCLMIVAGTMIHISARQIIDGMVFEWDDTNYVMTFLAG